MSEFSSVPFWHILFLSSWSGLILMNIFRKSSVLDQFYILFFLRSMQPSCGILLELFTYDAMEVGW